MSTGQLKSLLAVFSGDRKAKDRPQFSLKRGRGKNQKQTPPGQKKQKTIKNTSDWKQRQVTLLKSRIQT